MPTAISPTLPKNGLTKFTNCRLLKGNDLVWEDLWVSSITGKIIDSQASFYGGRNMPDNTLDLGGRIIAPGLIECQLNGAFGFNFSTLLDDMTEYGKNIQKVNRLMVQTGVTSYIPTVTSQRPELYQKVNRHHHCHSVGSLYMKLMPPADPPIPWSVWGTADPESRRRISRRSLRGSVLESYQERNPRYRCPYPSSLY